MKKNTIWLILAILSMTGTARIAAQDPATRATRVYEASGLTGGLVVHAGCGDGTLTVALRQSPSLLVQGLETDLTKLESARQAIRSKGLQGAVSVVAWDGKSLPYADNLVNLLVVEDAPQLSRAEMTRILAPEGVALLRKADGGYEKIIKPRPAEIDEWTHYLHGPHNSPVSKDLVVAPPRRFQWLADPLWTRHHEKMSSFSAMVSAKGRVFYIVDEQSPASMALPARWVLAARDAFNGVLLWKIPIGNWMTTQYTFKSGPAVLPRRLVAVEDRVYATMDITQAPVSVFNAADGRLVGDLENSQGAQEIVVIGDLILVIVMDQDQEKSFASRMGEEGRSFALKTYGHLYAPATRWIRAYDRASLKMAWEHSDGVTPMTLSADESSVYYHDGGFVVSLNLKDGKQNWKSDPAPMTKTIVSKYAPSLVVHGEVALFSGGPEKLPSGNAGVNPLLAFSTKTGKQIWTATHPQTGHESPKEILVIGGKVWLGEQANPKDSGEYASFDLQTGEETRRFGVDVSTHFFHHRCYMAKATERFILTSRKGVEFIDIKSGSWNINHWVRGACIYGIMPANGLLYAPPHPCACLPEAKLNGLCALAPERADPNPLQTELPRLEKGPAYDAMQKSAASLKDTPTSETKDSDWPIYRRDARRSGYSPASLPEKIAPAWRREIGGKLSPVTAADGALFVARVDAHEVLALDAQSGETRWVFSAEGRIDCPPSIFQGLALFGSADGHVYALRASDGALVWRMRAGLDDRRMVAFDQVESATPVKGGVNIINGRAWFVAGRSAFLDGGLRLLCVDPFSGEIVSENAIDDKDPETEKDLQSVFVGMNTPATLPEVLSSDGERVYMMSQVFDLGGSRKKIGPHASFGNENRPQTGEEAHLFSPYVGLMDDSWHGRTYWIFGRWFSGGSGGYYQAGQVAPSGRILVFDNEKVYGYGRKPEYFGWTTSIGYRMFKTSREPEIESIQVPGGGYAPGKTFVCDWSRDFPIHGRALVKAGDRLYVAGPPVVFDEGPRDQYGDIKITPEKQKEVADAWEGRKGASLLVLSVSDGEIKAEHKLDAPPRWDGMAAAGGRLFIPCEDGSVLCYAGE